MKKVLKSVVAVVLCLAMVLSLAACDPKYTNGISTEEFTDKKTGVSYKGRIKIGAAIARTGAYSLVGEPYGGFYDLYVRYINEELGGVAKGTGEGALGYKLEATTYDDQGDGAQGKNYIQKLVEDDGVFALVGNLGTWNIVAAQDYIEESGVPSVYWGTGSSYQYFNPAEGNERYTFPVQPIYNTEGRIMYLRAMQLLKAPELRPSAKSALSTLLPTTARASKPVSKSRETSTFRPILISPRLFLLRLILPLQPSWPLRFSW
ncbi:MAG: ABC transporter substrate-binding protein [Lachnospiraceae bacterium]